MYSSSGESQITKEVHFKILHGIYILIWIHRVLQCVKTTPSPFLSTEGCDHINYCMSDGKQWIGHNNNQAWLALFFVEFSLFLDTHHNADDVSIEKTKGSSKTESPFSNLCVRDITYKCELCVCVSFFLMATDPPRLIKISVKQSTCKPQIEICKPWLFIKSNL